jgi:hypothetical protein
VSAAWYAPRWAEQTADAEARAADRDRTVAERALASVERKERTAERMRAWAAYWSREGSSPVNAHAAWDVMTCRSCDGEGLFRDRDEGGWCAACEGTGYRTPEDAA